MTFAQQCWKMTTVQYSTVHVSTSASQSTVMLMYLLNKLLSSCRQHFFAGWITIWVQVNRCGNIPHQGHETASAKNGLHTLSNLNEVIGIWIYHLLKKKKNNRFDTLRNTPSVNVICSHYPWCETSPLQQPRPLPSVCTRGYQRV